jgi:hypothetical protein
MRLSTQLPRKDSLRNSVTIHHRDFEEANTTAEGVPASAVSEGVGELLLIASSATITSEGIFEIMSMSEAYHKQLLAARRCSY